MLKQSCSTKYPKGQPSNGDIEAEAYLDFLILRVQLDIGYLIGGWNPQLNDQLHLLEETNRHKILLDSMPYLLK